MNRYRQIIIYNELDKLADKIQASENYRTMLKGISEGKNGAAIARDIGCSGSRIRGMYLQYCKWCREYTGLVYFEDCCPISKDNYDELWKKYRAHHRIASEIEEEIKKEIKESQ